AGNRTLTGRDTIDNTVTATSGTISVGAAAAAGFVISAPSSTPAGVNFNVTVTAQDLYGNTATGYGGTLHFTSSDAAAVLPADATLTSGAGTFSAMFKTLGNQTITATDTVNA